MWISITQQQSRARRLREMLHLYPVGDAVGGGACGVLQTDDGRHHHVIRAAHQGSHKSEVAALLQLDSSLHGTLAMQQSAGKLCEQGVRGHAPHPQSGGAARALEAAAAGSALVLADQHDNVQACCTWDQAASVGSGKALTWAPDHPPLRRGGWREPARPSGRLPCGLNSEQHTAPSATPPVQQLLLAAAGRPEVRGKVTVTRTGNFMDTRCATFSMPDSRLPCKLYTGCL